MEELKTCPFCGGKAKLSICLGRKAIVCTSCESLMIGQPTFTKEEENAEVQHLIRAWNRRAASENKPLTFNPLEGHCVGCIYEFTDYENSGCKDCIRHVCKADFADKYTRKPKESENDERTI